MDYLVALTPVNREFEESDIDTSHPFQSYDDAFKYGSSIPSEDCTYRIYASNGEHFIKLFPGD